MLLCYGDSNTWGYDPRSLFGDRYPEDALWCTILGRKLGLPVRNLGLNGRSIPRREREIDRVMDMIRSSADECSSPIWFVVMLGSNDLLQGRLLTAEDVAARMEHFLEKIKTHPLAVSGRMRLCLISPVRMQPGEWVREERLLVESQRMGKAYRAVAARMGIAFLDAGDWEIPLAYDGVHFTQEGHRIFAEHCEAGFSSWITAES